MRKSIPIVACLAALSSVLATGAITWGQESGDRMKTKAELLKAWTGPYGGVPPWNLVHVESMPPAFDDAITESKAEIEKIANNPAPATFANTIVALEVAGRTLEQLGTLFDVHASNLNTGPMPDVERAVAPKLAEYDDWVTQHEKLFKRIESVFKGEEFKKLGAVEQRLVDHIYKEFVRKGASLTAADKKRLSQYNLRLATLFTDFSQNVLEDEKNYVTLIEKKEELGGLPESIVNAMASAAKERGKTGWAVTNTRSSMEPFLTNSTNRALREKVWKTYYSRGDNGDSHDNNGIISEILSLRAARAKLLGYQTHAHWRLEPTMAKTPEAALGLMMQVWPKAVQRVKEEVADMQALADKLDPGTKIEPWDYRFYAEKVRKAKYDLDLNEVKPYLQLEKLREGMMWASTQMYGFQYKQINDVPVFHPDVRVWEVSDKAGKLVGLWYFDPYARPGKRSGAWMNAYRNQENVTEPIATIVSNNSNFIKGNPGEPVLISWDDAVTLFHEFGHALHGLNSKVKYPSQSGTSVARDYVEFPSQLNEHWLTTDEVLNKFAVHYKTGEPLPKELLQKIKKASTFNTGFTTVEFLASALMDMKLHLAGDAKIDPDAFERKTLADLGMPKEIVMRHRTPQFSHVFADDGYSAGYYSYLWSDALTADAAELFDEKGYYDPETCKKLHDYVMSVGDTIDPAEGFRKFRGRDVDTAALLRKRGFPVN